MSNLDLSPVIDGILKVLESEEELLMELPEATIMQKRNTQNRTIKQLVGHLVDSASNNHQRMVRLQYNESLVFPDYTQDNDLWIAIQDYQHADWKSLVALWKFYNLHIVQVMKTADCSKFENYWHDFEGNKVTLRNMIEEYLPHLHLHIGEIHELIEA